MKEETQTKKQTILRTFSVEKLKQMFVKRTNDKLFESIGAMETGVVAQRSIPSHFLAWKGYEILTDSPFWTGK